MAARFFAGGILLPYSRTRSLFESIFDCVSGVPSVQFDGVPATGVKVAGDEWITGLIPSNPAGTCKTSVTISDGSILLELPQSFCYLG